MLINSEFKVYESCARGEARPTLGCVSVVSDWVPLPDLGEDGKPVLVLSDAGGGMHHGRAMATDGFILAVVPVLLGENDADGLIWREALAAAFKASKRLREPEVRVGLDQEDYIFLADGAMIPRLPGGAGDYGQFPDVAPVIPSRRPQPADRKYHLMGLNFNWGLLKRVAVSIGCKISDRGVGSQGSAFPRLSFGRISADGGTVEPIMIEASDRSIGASYAAPFGLLMPMHSKFADDYWAQD